MVEKSVTSAYSYGRRFSVFTVSILIVRCCMLRSWIPITAMRSPKGREWG